MLGTNILNTRVLNGKGDILPFTPLSNGEVSLGGVNLGVFGIGVQERNIDNAPKRIIKTANVPRGNGMTIIDDYFEAKNLEFSGRLRATSANEMATKMDELKKILSQKNAILDYNIRGINRRHVVNCTNMNSIFDMEKNWHITVRPVKLKFAAYTGFGSDLDFVSRSSFAETNLDFNIQVTNAGTVETDVKLVLIYASAVNIDSVTLNNLTNGKSIRVNTSVSAGDLIVIDKDEVLKNGSSAGVDFDGFFVGAETGVNVYQIIHEGVGTSAVVFDSTFKFKQNYL